MAAIDAEPQRRAKRRREIRARLAAIPEQLAQVDKQLESLPVTPPDLLAKAQGLDLEARRLALLKETPALKSELAKYEAEDAVNLVRLQHDLYTRQVASLDQRVRLLEERIKKARTDAAEQAVQKARLETMASDPALSAHLQRNYTLAEAAKTVAEQYDAADSELKSTKEVYAALLNQFTQTRKMVELVGLTSSIGAMLRKERATLPDIRQRRASVRERAREINDAQYELFQYNDERQELSHPEHIVRRIVADAMARGAHDVDVLAQASRDVLKRKREYLDTLIRNYNQYFDTLVELDTTEQQIISLTRRYRQYIDERVLWIRSGNLLVTELEFDATDAWMLQTDRWMEIPQRLWQDIRSQSVLYFVALALFAFVLLRFGRLRRELESLGEVAARPTCCQIGPTRRSIVITVALTAVWPGLIAFLAWRLNVAANGAAFAKAVGVGLLCMCAVWFPLRMVREVCRPMGLAEAHFDWPSSAAVLLRRNLLWLMVFALPLTFATSTLFACDPTHGRDAVERICFCLQALVLAWFLRRVLRPDGGVFREYLAYHQGGWVDQLKFVWYWLGVCAPLAIGLLAFWGYYYTAQVLFWRLYATICLVIALVLVRALLLRWVLLRRRKLSMDQARERAAAAAEAATAEPASVEADIVTELPQADLSAHSVQSQRLLTTAMLTAVLVGGWLIWVDVLPALSMLDRHPLWTSASVASPAETPTLPIQPPGQAATEPKPAAATPPPAPTNITFSNLALAILVTIITLISAQNVPGLLEISVLQRLPLDASVRYAITSLVSYAIILVGVIIACSNLGLRWSQIQWLATALTFGLAFGLQEIFANFVAGLIILFERPLRVGDVVTVDDITGVVSRIRIRATSITNWDRKEYVVPNKEFITGRLLNWTLSDKVNRILINVGIAYGSDTELAQELLLKVADEHPLTLEEPRSLATFEGFGDNSLNFVLRTFLPSMENRLHVIHELHSAIDREFRAAGIEISFPQRDLHIRTVPDSWLPTTQPPSPTNGPSSESPSS